MCEVAERQLINPVRIFWVFFMPDIPAAEESRIVNIDELPVYKQLFFSCSVNTSRVYLYDEVCVIHFTCFLILSIVRVCVGKFTSL